MPIPKIIHQLWIGPHPVPTTLMDTWKEKHPEFEYIFVLLTFLKKNGQCERGSLT